MPIKFDTLAELKAFYQAFTLSEKSSEDLPPASEDFSPPKKRGRKPGVKNIINTTTTTDIAPKKRGRKPGAVATQKSALKKTRTTISPGKPGRKPVTAKEKATSSKKES